MKLSELKKGLWGYQKESVYHYIALLEEEASEKLVQAAKEKELLENRIKELEASLETLRRENESLRRKQKKTADAQGEEKEQKQEKEQPVREGEKQRKTASRRRGSAAKRRNCRNKEKEGSAGKENIAGKPEERKMLHTQTGEAAYEG